MKGRMNYFFLATVIISLSTLSCTKYTTLAPDPGVVAQSNLNVMGAGVLAFSAYPPYEKKPINLWYFTPVDNPKDSPIVFVMHGTGRNASGYRDDWSNLAREHNLIIIVPEFSDEDFPGSRSYNLGSMYDEQDQLMKEEDRSFSLIEPIFDYVVQEIKGNQKQYNMYGHSAGSQFVSRYLTFKTNTRVNVAVCANAGWYTMLDRQREFPYGLRNSPASVERVKEIIGKEVIILLGEDDTDPNDSDLRNTPETLEQGPHRLARGNYFYNHVEELAKGENIPFHWTLKTVPGVAHNNAGMASSAVQFFVK